MKSTNAVDRCRNYDDLDALCSKARGLLYTPINDWDNLDAVLELEKNGKVMGIARIFSSPGKFGNKPVIELPKEGIDFMRELALLMGKAAAVIVRFRDTVKYWKIDRDLQPRQVMKRGKPVNLYLLPVNLLKNL